MSDKTIRLLATFFYIGYCPGGPGTAASLAGALLAVALHAVPVLYLVLLVVVVAIGFAVSGPMEDLMGQKDPQCIVIDEVAGVMVAFLFLPVNIPVFLTAFFLFRAFDMFKIYPVNKIESAEGAKGIMLDDLVAGVYTNVTMQIAIRWTGLF